MTLILERPWTTNQIGFVARKNNTYNRPIVGSMVDLRFEDYLPKSIKQANYIGKLPDIPSINQINQYIVSIFDQVEVIDQNTANKYLRNSDFIELPVDASSNLWAYSNAPWWEYVIVLDDYQGYIKAPMKGKERSGEPTPDQADELIDDYQENRNKIKVLAPTTLDKIRSKKLSESYTDKLDNILKPYH